MTRKDYIVLARALKLAREDEMRSGQMWRESGVRTAAQFIANELEDENPRFDRHHFFAVVMGEKALTSKPPRKVRIAESAASEQEKILARTGGNVEIITKV